MNKQLLSQGWSSQSHRSKTKGPQMFVMMLGQMDQLSSSAQPSDCEENKRPELKEEIVITQQQLLQEQLQDEETNKFREEALDCDSQFLIKQDILYWKQHHNSDSEDPDQALIVVPTVLRKPVLQAGHDLAGHFGSKKSKTLIQAHFWWPGMGRDIVQGMSHMPQVQPQENQEGASRRWGQTVVR